MMSKVLVVDDTKNIRVLLTTCLEIEGYTVHSVNDGEQALRVLGAERFDLIFLDIKLPEYSGTEILRRIRAAGIETPVVIMTAFATVKNAVECTKLGAVAYLQKPFTAEKIRNLLSEMDKEPPAKNDFSNELDSLGAAQTLIEQGQLDRAFQIVKALLANNPSCGETYRLLGEIHEARGNHQEAERFYTIAKQFRTS
jgi:two-component system OmpR family response regulator